eukprot:tig00000241_g20898.t1
MRFARTLAVVVGVALMLACASADVGQAPDSTSSIVHESKAGTETVNGRTLLAESSSSDSGDQKYNKTDPSYYTDEEINRYQLAMWTGVLLATVAASAAIILCSMDYSADSFLFSSSGKKD